MRRALVLLVVLSATLAAQTPARRATNLAALTSHPTFYHQRPILLVGTVALQDAGGLRVSSEGLSMRLVSKGPAPDGEDEIRGEFWDLGRMNADDPRLREYDLKRVFNIDPDAAWPQAGQVTAIVATSVMAAVPPAAPSIRNIVLFPSRYDGQQVTLVGQFGGRNLLGDLADAPARSRYDFVLRSADASIWVTNIRPRGKDWELALDARIDTGRWLEVSGIVQQGRGLQWLDATAGSLRLTQPPRETLEQTQIQVPAAPPPEVIFSAPTSDETEVLTTSTIRIQFSRDLDPATLKNRIAIGYGGSPAPDAADAAKADFTTQYLPGTRVLEIKFTTPLRPFSTVVVSLQDGILGRDKQALAPWQLKFETGRN